MIEQQGYYNINVWGAPYFKYNNGGQLEVSGVLLADVIAKVQKQNFNFPFLLRFPHILADRVKVIQTAFYQACRSQQYTGQYHLVYPIKVNQAPDVLKTLMQASDELGFEVGSKSELLGLLSVLDKKPRRIVCNGYKDKDYIQMALMTQKLGHEVYIVIEKESELETILTVSDVMQVQVKLGVRMRLVTKASGKWEKSAGENSKFGLNTQQLTNLISQLKQRNALDALVLLHCHCGSQIANLADIQACIDEITQYYVAMHALNAKIQVVDVGGGLAIDYEGCRQASAFSMNYSIQDYADAIVTSLHKVSKQEHLPVPDLISESGRAITAHHAVLIGNIKAFENNHSSLVQYSNTPHELQTQMRMILVTASHDSDYYAAQTILEHAYDLFRQGALTIQEKIELEAISYAVAEKVLENLSPEDALYAELKTKLAVKAYCNMSFFQSLPDAWAIDQVFPILPISGVQQSERIEVVLYDLTCDSDGVISQYVTEHGLAPSLSIPEPKSNQEYILAFFLLGAYQEVLGNFHNLFGRLPVVSVDIIDTHVTVSHIEAGDNLERILKSMHYALEHLGELNVYLDKSSYLGDEK